MPAPIIKPRRFVKADSYYRALARLMLAGAARIAQTSLGSERRGRVCCRPTGERGPEPSLIRLGPEVYSTFEIRPHVHPLSRRILRLLTGILSLSVRHGFYSLRSHKWSAPHLCQAFGIRGSTTSLPKFVHMRSKLCIDFKAMLP